MVVVMVMITTDMLIRIEYVCNGGGGGYLFRYLVGSEYTTGRTTMWLFISTITEAQHKCDYNWLKTLTLAGLKIIDPLQTVWLNEFSVSLLCVRS